MGGGIKAWPEGERPREKLVQQGAEALSDAELLALILRTGDATGSMTAIDLGRTILREFGDLRALAHATVGEICRIQGAGPAKAASIKAALELANRSKARRMQSRDRLSAPEQVFEHFHHQFRDKRKEYFLALLLDGKNRVLKIVQISEGSLNQESMYHLTTSIFGQMVH